MNPAPDGQQPSTTVTAALAAAACHDIVDLIADHAGTVVPGCCGEWFKSAGAYP